MMSTVWPILAIGVAIFLANGFAGLYGIALAAVGTHAFIKSILRWPHDRSTLRKELILRHPNDKLHLQRFSFDLSGNTHYNNLR